MYESRDAGDGTHYVIESPSGHLAHTDAPEGGQQAAVGLTEADADRIASELNQGGAR